MSLDLDRLRRLAAAGDRQAAEQLRAEAERRGDPVLAAQALAARAASPAPPRGVDAPLREALELLMACEPSADVWRDLLGLLERWPDGRDPRVAGAIQETLDAYWPDVLRRRAIKHHGARQAWRAPVTDWPLARTLVLADETPAALGELGALPGLEHIRHVELQTVGHDPQRARRTLDALCDTPGLDRVRALTVAPGDPVVGLLAERAGWLSRLEAVTFLPVERVSPTAVTNCERLLSQVAGVSHLGLPGPLAVALLGRSAIDWSSLRSLAVEACGITAKRLYYPWPRRIVPLQRLELTGFEARVLGRILDRHDVRHFERLVVRDVAKPPDVRAVASLATQLIAIEHLELTCRAGDTRVEAGIGEALGSIPALGLGLRTLVVEGLQLSAEALASWHQVNDRRGWLHRSDEQTGLRRLSLRACGLTRRELAALVAGPLTSGLEALDLRTNPLHADAIETLLEAAHAPRGLRELDLRGNPIGAAGARLLAEWPGARGLARLGVGHVGRDGVEALNRSPLLRGELHGETGGFRPPLWRSVSGCL